MNDYDKTLKWINKHRKISGLTPLSEIPCGEKGSARNCAVAKGLGEGSLVTPNWASIRDDTLGANHRPYRAERFPRYVKRFIQAFDSGKYPDLDLELWPSYVVWSATKISKGELVK